jgi:hypothetical protein
MRARNCAGEGTIVANPQQCPENAPIEAAIWLSFVDRGDVHGKVAQLRDVPR